VGIYNFVPRFINDYYYNDYLMKKLFLASLKFYDAWGFDSLNEPNLPNKIMLCVQHDCINARLLG